MQVGKTKDQGLYNKSQTVVHPGALAAGTVPQYHTNGHLAQLKNSSAVFNDAFNF